VKGISDHVWQCRIIPYFVIASPWQEATDAEFACKCAANRHFTAAEWYRFHNMRFRSSTVTLVAWVALCVALGSCKRVEEPPADERPRPAAASTDSTGVSTPGTAQTPPSPLVAPTQVLTLPSSAYQAALYADDDAIELLTSTAVYRLLPGKEPNARRLDSSVASTVTRNSYVYWSQGAIWSEPRSAAKSTGATKLAPFAEQPQRIVADITADRFALLLRVESNRHAIAKLEGQRVKALYTSPGTIDALTMIGDALYFVERPGGTTWRIGSIKLGGGDPVFTPDKPGRWPALLRGTKEVVYYDGARRGVFSLSPDLQHERALAEDFICSPLAVTTNVYCSTMEGIFELSAAGQRRQIVPPPRQLITNLAANSQRLVFISDAGVQGQDQLVVYAVQLPATTEAPP
jgi:hypothetical protein